MSRALPPCPHTSGRAKKTYRSKAKARQVAKITHSHKLYAYRCPTCGLWHLTHIEQRAIRPAA